MNKPSESYKRARNSLNNYLKNKEQYKIIEDEILGCKVPSYDGMPKPINKTSDMVFNQLVQLLKNDKLKKVAIETKAVELTVKQLNKDMLDLFNRIFISKENKIDTTIDTGLSERTYERKKKEIIGYVQENLEILEKIS